MAKYNAEPRGIKPEAAQPAILISAGFEAGALDTQNK